MQGAGLAITRRVTALKGSRDGRRRDDDLCERTQRPRRDRGQTFPTYAATSQAGRSSLAGAGAIMGLSLLRIIIDPPAAAIAYGPDISGWREQRPHLR